CRRRACRPAAPPAPGRGRAPPRKGNARAGTRSSADATGLPRTPAPARVISGERRSAWVSATCSPLLPSSFFRCCEVWAAPLAGSSSHVSSVTQIDDQARPEAGILEATILHGIAAWIGDDPGTPGPV